jgi:hypothetical protein
MPYQPQPIETASIELSKDLEELTEKLAEHAHDVWARQRQDDGWVLGPERDDVKREHPCLVPYALLPEEEKVYDRNAAMQTLRAILALGYKIIPPS